MVESTNSLSVKWIYSPNDEDKNNLKVILSETYPSYKKAINEIIIDWPDSTGYSIATKLGIFEEVTPFIHEMTQKLNSDDAYSDDFLLFELVALLDDDISAP